ncbi:helix-turn-helix domain-containing protein [Myroides odoratus]|uniref:helix-turn-helix domain-containing protein n=1 Tax=Myroides odoratus TaxID=256 RepID=UPI0039B05154
MKQIILPDELKLENKQAVQVYNYQSSQAITKQQITLNQHTFSFLIEGTKEVFFDHSSLTLDSSKFIIMRSGNCLMTEKLSAHNQYQSILLFFTKEQLSKFIQKTEFNLVPKKTYKSIHSFGYDEFIQGFVKSLVNISTLPQKLQNQLLEVKLEEIILYLIAQYGDDFLHGLLQKGDNTTQKFIHTIENNKFNKLSIKDLAFLCNMSTSTFKRHFEKHYTVSPMKWFQNERMEYAYYLLHQEQKSSSEIYLELGYQSLSSFIQAYKAKYGTTPKQHQKN